MKTMDTRREWVLSFGHAPAHARRAEAAALAREGHPQLVAAAAARRRPPVLLVTDVIVTESPEPAAADGRRSRMTKDSAVIPSPMAKVSFFFSPGPDTGSFFRRMGPVTMTRIPCEGELVQLGNDTNARAADYEVVLVHHLIASPRVDAEVYLRRVSNTEAIKRAEEAKTRNPLSTERAPPAMWE